MGSEDEQDKLCMILAEPKWRNQNREVQTDPSSGTYNLECDDTNGGEELEMIAVPRKLFRESSSVLGQYEIFSGLAVVLHFKHQDESRVRG